MIPDPVGDVRADNFLITTSEVIFVDWPSACIGAPLFDAIALLPSMALQGGPDPGSLLPRLRASASADPDAVTAVLAAIAGYFVHQSMQPAPKGIPAIREFQAAQGRVATAWLRRRTGWALARLGPVS